MCWPSVPQELTINIANPNIKISFDGRLIEFSDDIISSHLINRIAQSTRKAGIAKMMRIIFTSEILNMYIAMNIINSLKTLGASDREAAAECFFIPLRIPIKLPLIVTEKRTRISTIKRKFAESAGKFKKLNSGT